MTHSKAFEEALKKLDALVDIIDKNQQVPKPNEIVQILETLNVHKQELVAFDEGPPVPNPYDVSNGLLSLYYAYKHDATVVLPLLRLVAYLVSRFYWGMGYQYYLCGGDAGRLDYTESVYARHPKNVSLCQWASVALFTGNREIIIIKNYKPRVDDVLNLLLSILNKENLTDEDIDDATSVLWVLWICVPHTLTKPVSRDEDDWPDIFEKDEAFLDWKVHIEEWSSNYPYDKPYILLSIVVVKSLHSHPLLIYRYPEIHAYVTQLFFDAENAASMHTLLPDAYTHTRAHGNEHHLLGKPLSEWAQICLSIDQKRDTPVVPSPLPYPKPRTMNTIPDFSGEPVRFQSQQGDTLYVHPALLVPPFTGFMQWNTDGCIILNISMDALTIVVQSLLCATVTQTHLHPYSREQLLEGLEAAEQYQLTDLAHSLAARLTELLIGDGLSVKHLCNTWLRVKRPHLEYPMHAGLVDWCVQQLAQPCKVNELCDYLRTRSEDEDEEGDSSAETDDATESVGNKRKHQKTVTSPSSKRRRHAGLGENGIPADDGSQQGSKPFLPLLEDIAYKLSE